MCDGTKAYYELNEEGSARDCRLAYPINEYPVIIPPDLVLREETIATRIGDSATKVLLKWSLGEVVIHTRNRVLVGVDCQARCRVDNTNRTITIVATRDI